MDLQACLDEFELLTEQIAPIHVVYGPGGTWFLRRESLKAKLFREWQDTLSTEDRVPKPSEVEPYVLSDERWRTAIEENEKARLELYLMYGRRQVLRWMITWKIGITADDKFEDLPIQKDEDSRDSY